MPRSTPLRLVAVVASAGVITAGTWGVARWKPFEHERAEVVWPQNIEPLVDYIEDITSLTFRSSIDFEFIADAAAYSDRVRDESLENSPQRLAALEIDESIGRALGLWDGSASLIESRETIGAAQPRPARWLPDDNVMIIHARDERSALSPVLRADAIVYLTQAIVDQNFDLIARRRVADTSQQFDAIAALHIGHALWVHDQYVDTLANADRRRYEVDTEALSRQYTDLVDTVPVTFRAIRIAFQVLGPGFVTALAVDDPGLVIAAFGSELPHAMDQIALPTAKYVRQDRVEQVRDPAPPRGAVALQREQLGPFRIYLMLSTGLPANEALTASDGWGNDRYVAYELNGKQCVDVHIVADSPADADRLEAGLTAWAAARPTAADALVGRKDARLYASVCDPGTAVAQDVAGSAEVDQYFGRARLLRRQLAATGDAALAECIATDFYARFTSAQINDPTSGVDIAAEFAAIEEFCRRAL